MVSMMFLLQGRDRAGKHKQHYSAGDCEIKEERCCASEFVCVFHGHLVLSTCQNKNYRQADLFEGPECGLIQFQAARSRQRAKDLSYIKVNRIAVPVDVRIQDLRRLSECASGCESSGQGVQFWQQLQTMRLHTRRRESQVLPAPQQITLV